MIRSVVKTLYWRSWSFAGGIRWAGHISLGLGLLVLASICVAESATLQERIEKATVLRRLNMEGLTIRESRVVGDLGVLLAPKTDSAIVLGYRSGGMRCFRFAVPTRGAVSCYLHEVSGDGSTVIVVMPAGNDWFRAEIWDTSGTRRFEIDTPVDIVSSPRGKYFCNSNPTIERAVLTIWDSLGHRSDRLGWAPRTWAASFISDERLLIAQLDTARIVDVRSGQVLRSVALAFSKDGGPLQITSSRTRKHLAIHGDKEILVMTPTGEPLWRETFRDELCQVSLDEGTARVAMLFRTFREPYGYVRVHSVSPEGFDATSERTSLLGRAFLSLGFDYFWFQGGVITVWDPSLVLSGLLTSSTPRTLFYQVADQGSTELCQPVNGEGFYQPLGSNGDTGKYLKITQPRVVSILSLGKP